MDVQVEVAKRNASKALCNVFKNTFKPGSLIGVGTGSTIKLFIDICNDVLRKHVLVSSSVDTALYLKNKYGISTVDITGIDELDLYVDGADEVSTRLDLVKGYGGALLREKTLAYMARSRIYVVDYTKYTGLEYLYAKSIPVEVVPFALGYFLKTVKKLGIYEPIIRTGSGKHGPVITDNGNYIVDLKPLQPITNAAKAHLELKCIHGVVETGIFPSELLVETVIVGYEDKVVVLERERR